MNTIMMMKKIRKYLVTAFIVLITIIMSLLAFYRPSAGSKKPTFSGLDEDIYIELGITYSLTGNVSAYDTDGNDISANIRVSGSVDVFTLGEYNVTYSVKDKLGKETVKKTTYHVIDTTLPKFSWKSPIGLILQGNNANPNQFIEKIVDNLGIMDLEQLVVVSKVDSGVEGEYTIDYQISDESENLVNETYTVIVGTLREIIDNPITDDQVVIQGIQNVIRANEKIYTTDPTLLTEYIYLTDASDEHVKSIIDGLSEYNHFCVANNSNTLHPTIFIYYGR